MPHNSELPEPVIEDLFRVDLVDPSPDKLEMAISYIAEQIESFGFTANDVISKGVITTVKFATPHSVYVNSIKGILTINRLERNFSIEAQVTESDGGLFLPVTGSWVDIRTYLANLQRVTQRAGVAIWNAENENGGTN